MIYDLKFIENDSSLKQHYSYCMKYKSLILSKRTLTELIVTEHLDW